MSTLCKTKQIAWAIAFQVRKRQPEQIQIAVLECWEAIILNVEIPEQEGIYAMSCRVAAPSGLRWGGLLNTDPPKLALMSVGLIGFEA